MRNNFLKIVLYACLVLAIEAHAQYKVVFKKTGRVMEGTLIEENDKQIVLNTKGIEVTFKKEQLDLEKMKRLNREGASASSGKSIRSFDQSDINRIRIQNDDFQRLLVLYAFCQKLMERNQEVSRYSPASAKSHFAEIKQILTGYMLDLKEYIAAFGHREKEARILVKMEVEKLTDALQRCKSCSYKFELRKALDQKLAELSTYGEPDFFVENFETLIEGVSGRIPRVDDVDYTYPPRVQYCQKEILRLQKLFRSRKQ